MENRELGSGLAIASLISGTIATAGGALPVVGGFFAPVLGAVLAAGGVALVSTKKIASAVIGVGAVLVGATLVVPSIAMAALGATIAAVGLVVNYSHVLQKLPIVGKHIPKVA